MTSYAARSSGATMDKYASLAKCNGQASSRARVRPRWRPRSHDRSASFMDPRPGRVHNAAIRPPGTTTRTSSRSTSVRLSINSRSGVAGLSSMTMTWGTTVLGHDDPEFGRAEAQRTHQGAPMLLQVVLGVDGRHLVRRTQRRNVVGHVQSRADGCLSCRPPSTPPGTSSGTEVMSPDSDDASCSRVSPLQPSCGTSADRTTDPSGRSIRRPTTSSRITAALRRQLIVTVDPRKAPAGISRPDVSTSTTSYDYPTGRPSTSSTASVPQVCETSDASTSAGSLSASKSIGS